MKKLLLSLSLVIASMVASAQQYPCPFIDAGPDQNLPCGTNCTNLTASWLPAFATTSYSVAPISYSPYAYLNGVAPPNPFYTQDDFYSGVINLPFTFCFFGNAYNQCVIGNNSMISFNTAYAGQTNPWPMNTGGTGSGAPIPSGQNQLNAIFGPYMDIFPGQLSVADSNYINYATFGSAPCRKFVVSYYQVPFFGCTSTLMTSQIVLYETTNVIEIYIGDKGTCTSWNGNLALEGIQNATGSAGYAVPGRNVSQWNAHNDGYRFTPSGNNIVTVNWFQGSTPIGSGATVNVCPPNNHTTTYTAIATYNGCGNPISISDDVTVHVLQNAGGTQYVSCPSPTTSITTNATGTGTWTQIQGPASTTITPPTSPTATITGFSQAGTYMFSWSSGVCTDTLTVQVTQRPDAGPDQNKCRYDTATMNAYGTGTWSALSTNPHATHIDSPTAKNSIITGFDTGGVYHFVWTTGPGCSDTVVINIPFFDLATSTSSQTVCQYSNTTITVTPSTTNLGPFTYQWLQPTLVQSPNDPTTLINGLAGSTWFKVQVTSADGCKLIDSVRVNTSSNIGTNVRATATPDVICPGDPVTLVALANPNSCGAAVTTCSGAGTTVTIGTGTANQGGTGFVYPAPYGAYYQSAHHQFLIHANEIIGQVPTGGQIKSLALQIGTLNGGAPLQNFTISLACVGADSLDNAFLARGSLTQVYTTASYTPISGWNTHTFQTPYDWDGVSNLIVDICFSNVNGGNNNPKMKYTTTPFKSVWCTYANTPQCAVIGYQQNAPTTNASLYQRPNMRLNMCITYLNNANLQWTPSTGPNAPTPAAGDTVVSHPVSTTTYQVALTSSNGCINYAYATVNVDTTAKLTLLQDTFVCSIQPVRLNALLTGDSARPAQATYTWTASTGAAPPSGTGLSFATFTVTPTQTTTYTVVVTGGSRCTLVDSVTVTVGNGLPVPKLVDSITCTGLSDGRIHIYMNAGVAPYTYVWSTAVAGNVDSAVGLGPGTYTVSVTDAQGCVGRDTTRLLSPAPLTLRLDSVNIPCFGGGTGSVTAIVTGGRPAYTYVWTPSGSGSTLTNQPAGTYTVQVFDNTGCSITGTTHITQPAQVVSSAATTNLSGATTHDGTITVTTSGGTPGYTYTSLPAVSGLPNATGLDSGIYIITVCDANSCCVRDTAHITGPPPIDVIATITNNSCPGQCIGQISVTASGGVGPYTFSWNNTAPPTSGPSISGLCAGSYTVTTTDANGISVTNTFPVTAPPALADRIDSTQITCYGANDGALSDSAWGGTAPYTITWTPGGSNPLSGLAPGTYSVLITDANGCTLNDQASLGQPPQLVAVLDSTHPTFCYGSNDGTAWITVSGGTPPYDITWSGSNSTTTVANDLDAGSHTATITDAHGCSTTVTATITQPQQLVTTVSTTAAHCSSSNDGSATVSVTGGTGPYSYSWDNAFGTPTQNGLSSGSHTLVITDSYNCVVSTPVYVDTLYVLHDAMTSTPTSCFDGDDGTATVTTLNGGPVASYDWSDFSTVNPATMLSAGYATVTVTDIYGCYAIDSILVNEPPQLVAVAYWTDPLCHGDANGKIWFTATGGQGPYHYAYNGVNYQMTDTITGLPALPAPYVITVYDSKGCAENVAVTLHDPTVLTVDTVVTQITCANALDGAITANAAGGTPAYTYTWSAPVTTTTNTATGLAPGTYTVSVTDANGCTVANTVTLVAPPPISVTYLRADSVSCVGSADGHAVINVTGGTPGANPAYTYSLNGGTPQDSPDFYDLAAGVYHLEAVDSKGCHLDTTVTIETPPSITVAVDPLDTTLELGSSITLALLVDNPGGQNVTAYAWSPSSGLTCIDCPAPVATPYQRQDYTVVVTYGKNCIATASTTIRVDHGPDGYIPNAFSPNGDGTNDLFTVFGTTIKSVNMRIFNRWGEKVFDSGDSQWAQWDGSYKGTIQPPAVYTYVAEIIYLDGRKKIRDGSLTLIR